MNTNDNDNRSVPPVQLLIPLCETANDTGVSLAWLHAYCVVTIRPVGGVLQLNGRISLGQRYGENLELVRNLAAALNSGAVLAGHDLTDVISKLGRLSIDANDAKPALRLLAMLKCMLCCHDPINLAIDIDSQTQVAVQQLQLHPGMDQATKNAIDAGWFETGLGEVSVRPYRIASDLVERARACIGAIAEIYLAGEQKPVLRAAWEKWEHSIQPQIAALSVLHEIGGEPITIA